MGGRQRYQLNEGVGVKGVTNPAYDGAMEGFSFIDDGPKKGGVYCGRGRLALCLLGVAVLCTVVGVMTYYLSEEDVPECQDPTFDQCWDLVKTSNSSCNFSEEWPKPGDRPPDSSHFRLPDSLLPQHYLIELKPDFYGDHPDNFTLEGNVTMTLKVEKSTKSITFHIRKMTVLEEDVRVWTDDMEYEGLTVELVPKNEFCIIHLPSELEEGSLVYVFVPYESPLEQDNVGLYYSRYWEDGQMRYMLGTQFEPADARKAFPCLDEPAMKAYFNVTLWRKASHIALTNMPNYTSVTRDDWIIDYFERTPVLMPTYLLAFAWADFDYLETTSSGGLTEKNVRVWATHEAKATGQLDYSDEIAVKMFDELEKLFNIKFELPKLDKIPIREYKFGAMENWGLVTYDDTRLLVHPNYTSYYDQQRLTRTMSHELVHMWFGNQVTCKYWDEIWLHESFARFFEFYGFANDATPLKADWEHIYISQTFLRAFDIDDDGQAYPIQLSVRTMDEVEGVFTSIIYDKGSTVLRMMRKFAFENETDFITAQNQYLLDHAYGNTVYEDLVKSWAPHLSLGEDDFKEYLETWILQNGHPVITFTRQDQSTVQLTQNLFLVDPERPVRDKYPPPFGHKWVIPVSYVTSKEPSVNDMVTHWLEKEDDTIEVDGLDSTDWILGNPGLYTLYRVNYDEDNWAKLLDQLNSDPKVIDIRNRVQLVSDSLALSKAGLVAPELPLNISAYLVEEEEYLPWSAAGSGLTQLDRVMASTLHHGAFRKFVADLVRPNFNRLGWMDGGIDENLETKYLRSISISLACNSFMDECIANATDFFDRWVNQGQRSRTEIDPALREVIGCTHLRHRASSEDWDNLFNVYEEVKDFHKIERARIRDALACTRDEWQIKRYASMALLKDERIDDDDYGAILSNLAANPAARELIWRLLRADFENVPSSTSVLNTLANYFNTQVQLEEMEEFFLKYPPTLSQTPTYEAIRYKIRANIRWRKALVYSRLPF